jgi:hypothetical protein
MKILFEIDPEYDKKFIIVMLKGKDWEYRAKKMGLPKELVERIHNSSGDDLVQANKEIGEIVDGVYTSLSPFIHKACEGYQRSWGTIIEEFSQTVESLTTPWFYPEYVVKITHFNAGLSNWNGNVVGRWWRENIDTQRRITAHEILLAHFFTIHRNLYKDSGLTDEKIWALAEIFAIAMTGLVPELYKYWPWDKNGYYTNHNYAHIVDLQNELKEPFVKRANFDEYIQKGIELAKKYTVIK